MILGVIHPQPSKALVDSPKVLPLGELPRFLNEKELDYSLDPGERMIIETRLDLRQRPCRDDPDRRCYIYNRR